MGNHEVERTNTYIKYAIIILIIVLIVLSIFFVWQYASLRRSNIISARESWLTALMKRHGPATVNDVNFIRPWMTFDYINRLFNIPQDYLKNSLSLSDNGYPKLSLSSYAKHNNMTTDEVAGEVMKAIRNYLTK